MAIPMISMCEAKYEANFANWAGIRKSFLSVHGKDAVISQLRRRISLMGSFEVRWIYEAPSKFEVNMLPSRN